MRREQAVNIPHTREWFPEAFTNRPCCGKHGVQKHSPDSITPSLILGACDARLEDSWTKDGMYREIAFARLSSAPCSMRLNCLQLEAVSFRLTCDTGINSRVFARNATKQASMASMDCGTTMHRSVTSSLRGGKVRPEEVLELRNLAKSNCNAIYRHGCYYRKSWDTAENRLLRCTWDVN